ncbi:hypothetical protein ACTQ9L_12735 [Deinococcus wulumuqiensis]
MRGLRLMRGLWLLLPLLLTACQDREARAQNAELSRRVAALEAEVQALRKDRASPPALTPPADAAAVTARAAARNCATQLARTLEDYRRGSLEGRYPGAAEVSLPPPCQNQTVRWQTRTAQAYAFSVVGEDGQVLAGGEGPYTDSD